MKAMKIFFVFLYTTAPLIVLPYLAYKEDNWYILFGIAFSYLGVALAAYKPSIFYIFTLVCIGGWVRGGFNIHQYFTLFFFCMLGGFIFFKIADEYDNLGDKKANPEKLEEFGRIEKDINVALSQYKEDHPNEEITPEKIEEIKNRIFYTDAIKRIKS